jgi:iron complex outermembrane receptor protein
MAVRLKNEARGISMLLTRAFRAVVVALLSLLMLPALHAQEDPSELATLDLKALMNLEVTSVSRRPERLSDAAASIFVITAEDIRRSGAVSLPEALRLAPNLDVVQGSSSGYTVSARGFLNSSANKLLVLIDGRTVYTPFFSGVFWDVQDVILEDIDRIEVISGPGGTLWGVNAVNGIINIITRSAKNTHGGLVSAGGGNHERIGALRYGADAGAYGSFRGYGKYFERSHTETANGTPKDDAWHKGMAGFRGDWERGADQLSVTGNAYKGSEGQPLPGLLSISGVKLDLGTIDISGANLTARWKRRLKNDATLTVQGYVDQTERTVPPTFADRLSVADLQFLHALTIATNHSVSWGGEYRYGMDRTTNSQYIAFLPAKVNQKWIALFAQDEIALPQNLRLTIGARTEHNDYTGSEFLPNLRLAWKVRPDQLLWAAASRTVRAPSRFDADVFVPGNPPFLLNGGDEVVSETAEVYEVGYRGEPAPSTSLSVTAFHAIYDHLRTQEVAPSRTFLVFASGMKGTTTGLEAWASDQITQHWRLSAGVHMQSEHFELRPGSNDVTAPLAQRGRDPRNSWRLRSSWDLPSRTELDITARHVSSLTSPAVPAYSAVDIRYGWKPRPGMEVSITGVNLLGSGHGEFTDISTRTEISRGFFISFVSRFGRKS